MRRTLRDERAWAAGFYDGEGSTGCYRQRHKCCRATVSQTDVRILQRFQRAVGGTGHICGPFYVSNRKPLWTWNAHSYREAKSALEHLWPWMSRPKRTQALLAYQQWRAYKKTVRTYKRRLPK